MVLWMEWCKDVVYAHYYQVSWGVPCAWVHVVAAVNLITKNWLKQRWVFPLTFALSFTFIFHFQFCSSFFLRLFLYFFLFLFITSFALLTSIKISIWCSIPDFISPNKYTACKKKGRTKRALKLIIQHSKWWKIYYNFYLWALLGFCSVLI